LAFMVIRSFYSVRTATDGLNSLFWSEGRL